jgi:protein-S-isoprenylcysteine O-methyltransferase Ste14
LIAVKLSSAVIGTALFTLLVPAVMGGAVPAFIAPISEHAPGWAVSAGWLLILLGTLGYLWCALDFVRYGLGTPAPIAAPDQLVVRGLYRYSRNPMYVSVLLVVTGQAALRWSSGVLIYAAVFFVVVNLFILGYEEPTLARRFGEAYLVYRRRVPRWIGVVRRPGR